jgi:hypothetical protein
MSTPFPSATRRLRVGLALLSLVVLGASAPETTPEAPAVEHVPRTQGVEWPVTGPKVFDAMVLRPLGFCATIVGIAAFPIAAPLAAFGPGVGQTWDTFVVTPVDFTFTRKLGDF